MDMQLSRKLLQKFQRMKFCLVRNTDGSLYQKWQIRLLSILCRDSETPRRKHFLL